MKEIHAIGVDFKIIMFTFEFVVAAICVAGFTEMLFFSLGIEGDPDLGVKEGRIFSFFGKYWPLKCAFCFNFWVSASLYFALIYLSLGFEVAAVPFVFLFAGLSHIVLKVVKSLY